MAVPKKKGPLLNEIHECLWFTDGMVGRYKINPDNVSIQDAQFQQDNIEVRIITDKDIPALYRKEGAYALVEIEKGGCIIETLAAKYYEFGEWEFYGKQKDENDVIRFHHRGVDVIVEPWSDNKGYSKWRKCNDNKGSRSKKKANAFFFIDDDNEWNIPLVKLIALKDIRVNQQIFVAYGKKYWEAYHRWLKARK